MEATPPSMNVNSLPKGSFAPTMPQSMFSDATTALSSSQALIDKSKVGNIFQSGKDNPQNSLQNIKDLGMGALQSVGQLGVGAARLGENVANQTAGRAVNAIQGKGFTPLGNEALGGSLINPQDPKNQLIDSRLQAQNSTQGLGQFLGNVAQTAIPIGGVARGGVEAESLIGKAISPLKDFLDARRLKGATDAIASTAKTMTKGEQTAATEAGRLKPTITGAGKFVPSTTEENAGKLLAGQVTGNPIKDVPIIQKEIATRGTAAEQFLGMNGRPVTPDEATTAFNAAKEKASRYLTPEQLKNYDHTMAQFQAELKDIAGTDPIAQNTGTYYKALKNFEQNVTSRLRQGNEALLTDAGSAQLQAAKDVRTTIRDLIGQKNPEFKQQMYDLASLYDAQDNVIAKAVAHDTFSKAHPILSKALKYGAEVTGAGVVYEGAKKFGVPLP